MYSSKMYTKEEMDFLNMLKEKNIEVLYEQHGIYRCRVRIKEFEILVNNDEINLNELCQRLEPAWLKKNGQICLKTLIEPLFNEEVSHETIGNIELGIYEDKLFILDGGNRTRCIIGFCSGEYILCRNNIKIEPFCELKLKNKNGKEVIQKIAFKKSKLDKLQNDNYDILFSKEQQDIFLNNYIDLRIQIKPYNRDSMNKRFNAIQNQIPIGKRDSNFLKNQTHIPLVKFCLENELFKKIKDSYKKYANINKFCVDLSLLLVYLFKKYSENELSEEKIIEKYLSKDDKVMGDKILNYNPESTDIPTDELLFQDFEQFINEILLPILNKIDIKCKSKIIAYKSLINIIMKLNIRYKIEPEKIEKFLLDIKDEIIIFCERNSIAWYGRTSIEGMKYNYNDVLYSFKITSVFFNNKIKEYLLLNNEELREFDNESLISFITNDSSNDSSNDTKLKNNKKIKKQRIPQKIRIQLKKRDFKKQKKIICPCCNNINIHTGKNGFEAGHIIAESNGGEIKLNNLIPICKECNNDMKTKCLYQYQEERYPLVPSIREYMESLYGKTI